MADRPASAEQYSLPRRTFLKGLGAIGAAGFTGGSAEKPRESEYVADEINELMDDAADVAARDSRSGTDKKKLYIGHPNEYGFWGAHDNPAKSTTTEAIIEDGELAVDLVYIEEDIDEAEFQRRRRAEFRNYVENLDTFFGLDEDDRELLYDLAEALEAATYPDDFLDKAEYVMEQLSEVVDGAPHRSPYLKSAEIVLDEIADNLHTDADEYAIPDASLNEMRTTLEEMYQDLLDEYDVDVTVDVRRITEDELDEQGYAVEDVLPPHEGDRWSAFREDFGYDDGTLPVMLSTRDIGYGLDGLGTREQAFAHLPVDMLVRRDSLDDWALGRMVKDYLVPHEVGHAALHLPHNATRDGIMSYNKKNRTMQWLMGTGPVLSDWTQTLSRRLVTQDDVPAETADPQTVDHLSVYLEDMMGFEPVTMADEARYVPAEDAVRYVWDFNDQRIELDIEASRFFDRIATRTYRDGELVDEAEQTF